MSKTTQNKINIFPILNLTVLGLIFLAVALALFNAQFLKDSFIIWSNPTSPTVLSLVEDGGMNGKGQFYYKASIPELSSAEDFNEVCRKDREESDAILGCYTNQRIYVYDVQDERLAGVKEVTAVHEGLHAIYERLSVGDKNYVNGLLDNEYKKLANDSELKERMDYYARTEPGQFYNELHSIIATEKSDIGRSLEEYYGKYFSDRQKVVKMHLSYAGTIKALAEKAQKLNDEISVQKSQLEARIDNYNKEISALNNSIAVFNNNANTAGYYASQADFLQARRQLSNKASLIDKEYDAIKLEIQRHQQLVEEYNQTAVQVNEVNSSLNSTMAPKPSL